MHVQTHIRSAAVAIAAIIALILAFAWRAYRRDRAQLSAELASQKQALTQADARQHIRDAQLQQLLAAIATQKRKITTPAQILRALPKDLPLPQPITAQESGPTQPGPQRPPTHPVAQGCGVSSPEGLDSTPPSRQPPSKGSDTATTSNGREKQPASAGVIVPNADLKPLYDFALDCQACQAKLAAAQADLADEKARAVTLAGERDEALRVAKGGSVLRRIARASKWFLIGAAATAIATRAAK